MNPESTNPELDGLKSPKCWLIATGIMLFVSGFPAVIEAWL